MLTGILYASSTGQRLTHTNVYVRGLTSQETIVTTSFSTCPFTTGITAIIQCVEQVGELAIGAQYSVDYTTTIDFPANCDNDQ